MKVYWEQKTTHHKPPAGFKCLAGTIDKQLVCEPGDILSIAIEIDYHTSTCKVVDYSIKKKTK